MGVCPCYQERSGPQNRGLKTVIIFKSRDEIKDCIFKRLCDSIKIKSTYNDDEFQLLVFRKCSIVKISIWINVKESITISIAWLINQTNFCLALKDIWYFGLRLPRLSYYACCAWIFQIADKRKVSFDFSSDEGQLG